MWVRGPVVSDQPEPESAYPGGAARDPLLPPERPVNLKHTAVNCWCGFSWDLKPR